MHLGGAVGTPLARDGTGNGITKICISNVTKNTRKTLFLQGASLTVFHGPIFASFRATAMAGPGIVGHWAAGSGFSHVCRRRFWWPRTFRSGQVRQPDEPGLQQGVPVMDEVSLVEGVYPGGAHAG